MNFAGVIIGTVTIGSISLFHPLVIKAEYRWGLRATWIFLAVGVLSMGILAGVHFVIEDPLCRQLTEIALSIFAFSSFWSAYEISRQHKRVLSGRFPKNPNHPEYYM